MWIYFCFLPVSWQWIMESWLCCQYLINSILELIIWAKCDTPKHRLQPAKDTSIYPYLKQKPKAMLWKVYPELVNSHLIRFFPERFYSNLITSQIHVFANWNLNLLKFFTNSIGCPLLSSPLFPSCIFTLLGTGIHCPSSVIFGIPQLFWTRHDCPWTCFVQETSLLEDTPDETDWGLNSASHCGPWCGSLCTLLPWCLVMGHSQYMFHLPDSTPW